MLIIFQRTKKVKKKSDSTHGSKIIRQRAQLIASPQTFSLSQTAGKHKEDGFIAENIFFHTDYSFKVLKMSASYTNKEKEVWGSPG